MTETSIRLTHERLLALLHYDPETGVWRWRITLGSHGHAGSEAGYIKRGSHGPHYRYIGVNGESYLAHRLAWLYMTGSWPIGHIDHRDCDGLNNRWANLREATHSQNAGNKARFKNNTSGFKGVTFNKGCQKFQAQIHFNRKLIYLGLYDTPEAAAAAYAAAAKQQFGEFARVK